MHCTLPASGGHALARSATPSADSVGGSVVSVAAPSATESEQFELLSNELLEGIAHVSEQASAGRSQLSECAQALVTQTQHTLAGPRASQLPAGPSQLTVASASATPLMAPPHGAHEQSEVDSWEDELQAELDKIESSMPTSE